MDRKKESEWENNMERKKWRVNRVNRWMRKKRMNGKRMCIEKPVLGKKDVKEKRERR